MVSLVALVPLCEQATAGELLFGGRLRPRSYAVHRLGAELEADGDGMVIGHGVGLHVRIGDAARQEGKITNSISGQLMELRAVLMNATGDVRSAASQALAVRVNNADEILGVLKAVADIDYVTNLVIVGGAEADLVAPRECID